MFLGGRWWTVLSASWLHGGLLHILFNMMWIRQLAPAVAELYGPGPDGHHLHGRGRRRLRADVDRRRVLWFLPFLQGAPFTVGASAAIFGLLGALVYYGRRTARTSCTRRRCTARVTLFVFGLIMPGVDNYAHAGGFLGGYVAGRMLDPLKPERDQPSVSALVLPRAVASLDHRVGHSRGLAMR